MGVTSISAFKALITARHGLALQNRFQVKVTVPTAVTTALGTSVSISDLNILCDAAGLPERQISTFEYQAEKQIVRHPSGFVNSDVVLTFHLTNDYFVKQVFDAWATAVVDSEDYRVNYFDNFIADIEIWQLNKAGFPVYGVLLQNAYPITNFGPPLDNKSESTTQTYSVTLTYENWIVLPIPD
jgi:hypothetical protein